MWVRVSRIILRNRILLLSILAVITIFFGYHARKVEMSYEYASLLPKKDPAYKDYLKFVDVFGEEGNLIIVGIKDTAFFTLDHFNRWERLSKELSNIDGVENLLSVTNTYNLVKDTENKQFRVVKAFPDTIASQEALDEFKKIDGWQIKTEMSMNMMGAEMKTSTEVVEISEKTPPEGTFSVPAGYTKKEKFTMQDLQKR